MATNFVQIENDAEIKQRLEAERARLIRKRKAAQEIEGQLAALEAQLRRERIDSDILPPALEAEAQGMAAD